MANRGRPLPGQKLTGRWQGSVLDAVWAGNGRGDRGKRDNKPPLSEETRLLGEGVNGRRGRPTAALDEADAVIGDGALAGIAGAPAPLAVIAPAPAEGCMGLWVYEPAS